MTASLLRSLRCGEKVVLARSVALGFQNTTRCIFCAGEFGILTMEEDIVGMNYRYVSSQDGL